LYVSPSLIHYCCVSNRIISATYTGIASDFIELVLNVAWFILATASFVLLFQHLASRGVKRASGPSRCQCVVALGCVLAILFPVISLTDDLHDMQATVEESSSSSVIVKRSGVHRLSTPVCTPHQLLYVGASFRATTGWVTSGNIATQRTSRLSPELWSTSLDRAPPSSLSHQLANEL